RAPPERRTEVGRRVSAHDAPVPPAEPGGTAPGPLDTYGDRRPRMREIPGSGRELRAGPAAFPQQDQSVAEARSRTVERRGGLHMLGRGLARGVPLVTLAVMALAGPALALDVGQKAPDFTLNAPGGKQVKLADLLGKGPIVLYTFIGAFNGP